MPDISGFTSFVRSTEQEHARHIISELIGLIIEEGAPYFKVAEVEGDAVFFYREDEAYPISRITSISKKIYGRFHAHLQQYEHRRICSCGACSTAANLRLKFIAHLGKIGFIDVNGGLKPFGEAVIQVHRLLKNKVDAKEYVLFSNKFPKDNSLDFDGTGVYEDESLGDIHYAFTLIKDWDIPLIFSTQTGSEVFVDLIKEKAREYTISAADIHEMVINLKYRHLWNKGVDRIIYDEDEMNQVSARHHCIINGKELEFTTVRPGPVDEVLSYGEVLSNPKPFSYFEFNFFFEPVDPDKTIATVRLKVGLPWYMKPISFLFSSPLKKRVDQLLDNLETGVAEYSVLHSLNGE